MPSFYDSPKKVSSGKNPETTHAETIAKVKTAFVERAQREEERRLQAIDSEYWCCICFQSRAQVEEFITQLGLMTPDNPKYLDGREVMKRLQMTLAAPDPEWRESRKDASWLEFVK